MRYDLTDQSERFNGSIDADEIYALGGSDTIDGGPGDDTIDGGAGGDFLYGSGGADRLLGGGSDDWLVGGSGNDTLDGGTGYDRADYRSVLGGIIADLSQGLVLNDGFGAVDTLINIDQILGSPFADRMLGSSGTDSFTSEGGNDTIDGGAGNDILSFSRARAPITVDLAAGTATGQGDLTLAGIETLFGSGFNDVMLGGDVAERLIGAAGDDRIEGRGGADTIEGGAGNDTIDGGAGADSVLVSGSRSNVAITRQGNTVIVSGPDGVDTLTNVERLYLDGDVLVVGTPDWQPLESNFVRVSGNQIFQARQEFIAEEPDPNGGVRGSRVVIEGPSGVTVDAKLRPGWDLSAIGDIDGNGLSELLFVMQPSGSNPLGGVATWEIAADGAVVRTQMHQGLRRPHWQAVGVANVNGIAGGEIIWQNTLTGAKAIWTDNDQTGLIDMGFGITGLDANPDERIVGVTDLDNDRLFELVTFNDATGAVVAHELTPGPQGSVTVTSRTDFADFSAFNTAVTAGNAPLGLFPVNI